MQFGELARGAATPRSPSAARASRPRCATTIEQNGWDGAWYRRAWFDDGSPLGSSTNAECRIDSIAQSWSVIVRSGRCAARAHGDGCGRSQLVHRDAALIQLLDPPFDQSDPNPGYIKGTCRGVRENGGQYTHAAVWAAMAFAALGDAERAWELFTLINPVNHAETPEAIALYKTEPYVLAADVYALAPHTGPRRLDVVHGLGRLDVPADRGIAARFAPGRRHTPHRALPAVGLDDLHAAVSVP